GRLRSPRPTRCAWPRSRRRPRSGSTGRCHRSSFARLALHHARERCRLVVESQPRFRRLAHGVVQHLDLGGDLGEALGVVLQALQFQDLIHVGLLQKRSLRSASRAWSSAEKVMILRCFWSNFMPMPSLHAASVALSASKAKYTSRRFLSV